MLALAGALLGQPAIAAAAEGTGPSLRIGWISDPPRTFEVEGRPAGIQLDLWRQISLQLGLKTTFVRQTSLDVLFDRLRTGELDAAVGSFTVTPDRLAAFPLTITTSETTYAVYRRSSLFQPLLLAAELATSAEAIKAYALLAAIVLMLTLPTWYWEKQTGRELPAKGRLHELVYFMQQTLLASGSHATRSRTRVLTVANKFLTQVFVAAVFAAFAISKYNQASSVGRISSLDDLRSLTAPVAVLSGSFMDVELANQAVSRRSCASIDACLALVRRGAVAAAVLSTYDADWYCRRGACRDISKQSLALIPQIEAWMLAPSSPLVARLGALNALLAKSYQNGDYQRIVDRYRAAP